MSIELIWLLVGLVAGIAIGMVIMCLCVAAGQDKRDG